MSVYLVLCAALGGCRDAEKERAKVEFHSEAVRKTIKINRDVAGLFKAGKLVEPSYDIRTATDVLDRALYGLPGRVEKKAKTRVEERKAAAVKARKIFAELRPKLESMKFELADVNAKFDEIERLIDEVERE